MKEMSPKTENGYIYVAQGKREKYLYNINKIGRMAFQIFNYSSHKIAFALAV